MGFSQGSEGFFIDGGGLRAVWSFSRREMETSAYGKLFLEQVMGLQKIHFPIANLFVGEVIEAYADEALVKGERSVEHPKDDFPMKIYVTRFGEILD